MTDEKDNVIQGNFGGRQEVPIGELDDDTQYQMSGEALKTLLVVESDLNLYIGLPFCQKALESDKYNRVDLINFVEGLVDRIKDDYEDLLEDLLIYDKVAEELLISYEESKL